MSKEHKINRSVFDDELAFEFGRMIGMFARIGGNMMIGTEEQKLKREIRMLKLENELLRKGYGDRLIDT